MATLDDIDRWNVLRIELENGDVVERAVAEAGPVEGAHERFTDVGIDPNDPYTPDDVGKLSEVGGELEFYPDKDEDESYGVADVTVIEDDARE